MTDQERIAELEDGYREILSLLALNEMTEEEELIWYIATQKLGGR